ncbi:MAG: AAA family ATPase [Rhodoferax sp.]|nr:AAA family ATPase [Rhodoferax sp.]
MPHKTTPPRVVIFAGPNGAGKSTHADAILASLDIETFVNADYIARGLTGRHTDAVAFEAGRIMLQRLRQLSDAGADFAFESTLSSRTFAALLGTLKRNGYVVAIYYFSLANAQLAIRRVKLRVVLGGHDVPTDVVRRRFGRSLNNFFNLYMPLADEWTMFDNSTTPFARVIAAKLANQLTVTEPATWHKLQKLSQTGS